MWLSVIGFSACSWDRLSHVMDVWVKIKLLVLQCVIVWTFWGNGPFHLSCQIYMCRVVCSFHLFFSCLQSPWCCPLVYCRFMSFLFFSLPVLRNLSILLIFLNNYFFVISIFLYYFPIFIFNGFVFFILIVSSLLLVLSLFCFSFSSFLRWQLEYWFISYFLIYTINTINFHTALAVSYKFWCDLLTYSLSSVHFKISFETFSWPMYCLEVFS